MFEGVPTFPDAGRFWQVIDKHGVNIFYTAPTAIRSLMAQGLDHVLAYSLDSLKVIGSVGEPINEEAWQWYKLHIGKNRCPIVDTWWQTETAGIMISSIAGVTDEKPSHAAYPLPGVQAVLLTADGQEITENEVEGMLCMKFPWPSILRTTWGDHERYKQTYFSSYPGHYFSGDGAKRDAEGRYRIIGRVDDVINVSGHRFGTAEVESAINLSERVVESAVVGYPHDIKGPRHLRVRHHRRAARPQRQGRRGPHHRRDRGIRGGQHRAHRQAGQDPVRERAAEDAFRQDHAPDPAQDRRRGDEQPGRYHDIAGPERGGRDQGGEGVSPCLNPRMLAATSLRKERLLLSLPGSSHSGRT
jgi:acyl-CoA synthetase (AMP-forming)/AMP-acid ligase II